MILCSRNDFGHGSPQVHFFQHGRKALVRNILVWIFACLAASIPPITSVWEDSSAQPGGLLHCLENIIWQSWRHLRGIVLQSYNVTHPKPTSWYGCLKRLQLLSEQATKHFIFIFFYNLDHHRNASVLKRIVIAAMKMFWIGFVANLLFRSQVHIYKAKPDQVHIYKAQVIGIGKKSQIGILPDLSSCEQSNWQKHKNSPSWTIRPFSVITINILSMNIYILLPAHTQSITIILSGCRL